MNEKKTPKKREPWRIAVAAASVLFIIVLWVKKDVAAIYSQLSPEDALPLVVTTVAVTALKVAAMAGAVLLVKWLIRKIRDKNDK